jgi:DNA repair exonuclease SbcCD ATPase subunit
MTSISDDNGSSEERIFCATCGSPADESAERCGECGAGFPRTKCPRCSRILAWGASKCGDCGYQFEDRAAPEAETTSRIPRQLEEPYNNVRGFIDGRIEQIENQLSETKNDQQPESMNEHHLRQLPQEKEELLSVQGHLTEMMKVLQNLIDMKEGGLRSAMEALTEEVQRRKGVEEELNEKNSLLAKHQAEMQADIKEKEELRERLHMIQENYSEVVKNQEVLVQVKALLEIMDGLLAKLPKKHLDAFANSKEYRLYEEVMGQLGVGK